MEKYKSLTRTTLHDLDDIPHAGVYIIAYMGKILYVGKSNDSIIRRLRNHLEQADTEILGGWMYKIKMDWHNVRIDILEPPDNESVNVDLWLRNLEAALVRKFNPLFNIHLM